MSTHRRWWQSLLLAAVPGSAAALRIVCPVGPHACQIDCKQTDGCKAATVTCAAGTCAMSCGATANVRQDSKLICGSNDCSVTCGGASKPSVTCGAVCRCTTC